MVTSWFNFSNLIITINTKQIKLKVVMYKIRSDPRPTSIISAIELFS
jgi:hypothetical protein